jgi:hypothetical protein
MDGVPRRLSRVRLVTSARFIMQRRVPSNWVEHKNELPSRQLVNGPISGVVGPGHLADTRKYLSLAAAFDWQYILHDPPAPRTPLAGMIKDTEGLSPPWQDRENTQSCCRSAEEADSCPIPAPRPKRSRS